MSLSRRGQVFASLCLLSFLVNFGRVAFAPLVDPFMGIFQVGPGAAGLVATAVWVGSGLTRIPTGWLLTRIDRHEAIAGMGVFLAGAAAFTALAPTITVVAVGALLIGLATGVFYVAATPLVGELYPERMGWAVGIRGTASQLAAAATPPSIRRSWRTPATPTWPPRTPASRASRPWRRSSARWTSTSAGRGRRPRASATLDTCCSRGSPDYAGAAGAVARGFARGCPAAAAASPWTARRLAASTVPRTLRP